MQDSEEIATLRSQIQEAEWQWIQPHTERDAVIYVQMDLDLATVASYVVQDNVKMIEEWVKSNRVRKPTEAEIQNWNTEPSLRFRFLICQPYVLVQEHLGH